MLPEATVGGENPWISASLRAKSGIVAKQEEAGQSSEVRASRKPGRTCSLADRRKGRQSLKA